MSLINNTLNFANPRDRQSSTLPAKSITINKIIAPSGELVLGTQQSAVANASSGVTTRITDNSAGSVNTFIEGVPSAPSTNDISSSLANIYNNNFASLASRTNSLTNDIDDVRDQLNELLAAMRSFGMISS